MTSKCRCSDEDGRKGARIDFESEEEKESGGEEIAQGCEETVGLFADGSRDCNADEKGSYGG